MGVSGQRHAPAALYPRWKDPRYPMYRRLGGPQSRSGHRGYRKNPFSSAGYRTSITRSSSPQPDSILTELTRSERSINIYFREITYHVNWGELTQFFVTVVMTIPDDVIRGLIWNPSNSCVLSKDIVPDRNSVQEDCKMEPTWQLLSYIVTTRVWWRHWDKWSRRYPVIEARLLELLAGKWASLWVWRRVRQHF
jgi:hypothetical protein